MEKVNLKPYCNICNKYYKSQSSLCNHNKKFHPENKPKSTFDQPKSTFDQPKSTFDQLFTFKYHCKYCNKGYNIKFIIYNNSHNILNK